MSQNTTGLFLYHNTTEEGCRHDRRVSPPVEGQWHTAGNQRSGIQKDPASCLLVTCLRTVYKQLNKSKCTPGGARLRSDNMPSPRSLPLQGLSHLTPSHPSTSPPKLGSTMWSFICGSLQYRDVSNSAPSGQPVGGSSLFY